MLSLGITDSDRYKPTVLKLIQTTAATEDMPAGVFFDPVANYHTKGMDIVVLTIQDARSKMPPKSGGFDNVRPVCKSNDGINPVGGALFPRLDKGRGCAKCEFSQWVEIGGKKIRPECNENYYLTFMDANTRFVYRLMAKGTSCSNVGNESNSLIWVLPRRFGTGV